MQNANADLVRCITEALLQDQHVWAAIIEVYDEGGIVRLCGHVSSEEGRQAVEEIARRQTSVAAVVNDLQTSP